MYTFLQWETDVHFKLQPFCRLKFFPETFAGNFFGTVMWVVIFES